jgi:hypothetical protein
MRLVRQYRTDTKHLIFRICAYVLVVGCLIVVADRVAYVGATLYFDSKDQEHDDEVLRLSSKEPPQKALPALIAQKEQVLKELRNEKTIRQVSAELAKLYEEKGENSIASAGQYELKGNRGLADSQLVLAEDSYRHAIEFAPSNALYYANLARLFYKVSRQQKDLEIRCGLLRTATTEYQGAVDRVPVNQKGPLSDEAAAKWLELAKLELTVPKHRMDAASDLQKGLRLAPAGSAVYADITRTIQSIGSNPS